MKRVVLLGDSIRIFYQDNVREKLQGICEVLTPPENCAYTLHTIRRVRDYFSEWGKVDLIHWNNGIWDHHRNAEDGLAFSTPEIYYSLTCRLYKQLTKYSDKIIWATTTPGGLQYDPDSHILLTLSREEWNREITLYNDMMSAFFRSEGVPVNDLYSILDSDPGRYICEDGIHLSPEGKDAAAEQVANQIRAMLGV